VFGSTTPVVTVSVDPNRSAGTVTPGAGFVVNTPGIQGGFPTNDSNFLTLASNLHPSVIRFGTDITAISYSWNTVTNQPKFDFSYFDRWVSVAHELHVQILLSLPAGSWGDGNILPAGMPLNHSLIVNGPSGTGYFPDDAAWQKWVEGVVNHTTATGADISYWNVGNEVPTYNLTEVAGYTNVFNIAERTILAQQSSARVGSDVMTNLTYESYFATHARGVGFLSFHYYPTVGLCLQAGRYCPPAGPPDGSTDPGIFSHPAYTFLGRSYAPKAAQSLWENLSGNWVPVLNSETNLNAIGGGSADYSIGTDPRIQTLFGASWLISTLIDGARQNVSELAYFALSSGFSTPTTDTSSFGGWGFGLSREGTNGTDVLFAPYLAMQMWSSAIPPGEPDVLTESSAPAMVYSYAAHNGADLSLILVNRANVPVTVTLNLSSGNYSIDTISTLDQRGYSETYEADHNTTVLKLAKVMVSHPTTWSSVTIDGYGVVVVSLVPRECSGGAGHGCPAAGNNALTLEIVGAGTGVGGGLALISAYWSRRFRRISK